MSKEQEVLDVQRAWRLSHPTTLVGERGSGKTTRLIQLANHNNGVIICPSKPYVSYVNKMSTHLGCGDVEAFTVAEVVNNPEVIKGRDVYVDETEIVLTQLLGGEGNVRGVTILDAGGIVEVVQLTTPA